MDRTGAAPAEVVKAYLISRTVFGLSRLWREIEALDNKASAAIQTRLNLDILRLLKRSAIWLLRNGPRPLGIALAIERFESGIGTLARGLSGLIPGATAAEIEGEARRAVEAGVPAPLAREVANLGSALLGLRHCQHRQRRRSRRRRGRAGLFRPRAQVGPGLAARLCYGVARGNGMAVQGRRFDRRRPLCSAARADRPHVGGGETRTGRRRRPGLVEGQRAIHRPTPKAS